MADVNELTRRLMRSIALHWSANGFILAIAVISLPKRQRHGGSECVFGLQYLVAYRYNLLLLCSCFVVLSVCVLSVFCSVRRSLGSLPTAYCTYVTRVLFISLDLFSFLISVQNVQRQTKIYCDHDTMA
jgi:hypothetical protein